MYRWLVALLLLTAQGTTLAQAGKTPWEELGNRLKASQEVSALGPDLFGDQVSLSNGALSFSATDLSIPGNNALPVAFSRSYRVRDWRYRVADGMLKDWDVELPNISSVGFAAWEDSDGNQARCTVGGASPSPASGLHPIDYWQGTNLDIPGVSSGELLRTHSGTLTPNNGGPYLWMTNDQVQISCLPTIKNGTGQGFLAVAPDGTKYWFDWMARHAEPVLKHVDAIFNPGGAPFIQYHPRYRHVLYVSRVEDRFGNSVDYTYTNTASQPGKLTQITSSDGRSITINYSGSAVSSVSDGARTWSYGYGSTSSGRGTLTSVTQPDGKIWSIDFADFTNAEIQTLEYTPYGEEVRTCWWLELPQNYASEPVGTMTHPSGATGSFRLYIAQHGRSNVPLNCRNVTVGGTGNNRNDDSPLYPISAYAFTLKRKTISGVGMATLAWDYAYEPNIGHLQVRGATHQYPVCTLGTTECQEPVCTDDACAGSSVTTVTGPDGEWVRHSYGNSYLYNEGKLISIEVGSGSTSSAPLRKTTHSYDLSMTDGPYKARWGSGYRAYGDSFQSEYHRPQVKSVVEQDGGLFVWEVPTGCSTTYPDSYCMDSLARPIRIVRSGTVATSPTGEDPIVPPSVAPTLTVPATSSTGSYSATWTTVASATSYQLQEKLGTGSWSTIHDGSATSKTVSGKGNGSWNYQVRACNSGGCGAWSATQTTVVTLTPDIPGVPVLTTPATSSTGSYSATWTTVASATSYQLQEKLGTGSWSTIHNGSATSKAVSGKGNGSWSYQVRACNSTGCGAWSGTRTTVVTLPPDIPGVPVLTTPASSSTGSYSASWTTVASATSYQLQEKLGTGSWSTIHDGSATSKAVSGKGNGSWGYQVRACNSAGCSAWSATQTTVVTLPPTGVPVLTTPASNTSGSYTVSWTTVAGATRYELDQRKDAGAWSKIHDASATSKTLSGQTVGTYGYRVRACNTGGCGAYSTTSNTTVSSPPLGTPTLTAPLKVNSGEAFTVSWTSINGATQYILERNRNGGAFVTVYDGAATSKSETIALLGTFRYRVKACNSGGCGSLSGDRIVMVEAGGGVIQVQGPETLSLEQDGRSMSSAAGETTDSEGNDGEGSE